MCTRVAIVAGGRLRACGTLADMSEFAIRGWELVVAGLTPVSRDQLSGRATSVTEISDGRYALVLPAGTEPERVLSEVAALGGHLVSLMPLRDTLEDVFVRYVESSGPAPGRQVTR